MFSYENDLAEIRGSIGLQVTGHIGDPSRLRHLQNRVCNLPDLGYVERVKVGFEDIRVDSSPVVVDIADEVQHVLIRMIQIGILRVRSIRNPHGTSLFEPSMVL